MKCLGIFMCLRQKPVGLIDTMQAFRKICSGHSLRHLHRNSKSPRHLKPGICVSTIETSSRCVAARTVMSSPLRHYNLNHMHQQKYVGGTFGETIPAASMVTEVIGAKIRGIQKDISPLSTKRIVRRKRPKDLVARDQEVFDVTAYAAAEEINLESMRYDLERQGLYNICKLPSDVKDAMHVSAKYRIEDETREIFFFREGSVVFWNMPDVERQNVLQFMRRHQDDSYDMRLIQQEFEQVEYSYTDAATQLAGDEIQLRKSKDKDEMDLQLEKYAFSNALTLSVKLAIWEASLARYVDSVEWVLQDLKDGRKLRISRAETLRKMGELYTLRHLVNLSSDLLDTPDFYWDRERLEQLYQKTINQFSIPRRVKVINEKLNLSCEMMNLLINQLNDANSTRLEWMIVILIMIEVLFEVAKLIGVHG